MKTLRFEIVKSLVKTCEKLPRKNKRFFLISVSFESRVSKISYAMYFSYLFKPQNKKKTKPHQNYKELFLLD